MSKNQFVISCPDSLASLRGEPPPEAESTEQVCSQTPLSQAHWSGSQRGETPDVSWRARSGAETSHSFRVSPQKNWWGCWQLPRETRRIRWLICGRAVTWCQTYIKNVKTNIMRLLYFSRSQLFFFFLTCPHSHMNSSTLSLTPSKDAFTHRL